MFGIPDEKHEVTYACGHSETRVKSRSDTSNAMHIRAAARSLCKACLAEHQARREGMISNSVQRTKEAVAGKKLTCVYRQLKRGRSGDEVRPAWLVN
jgi:hypothetical protein